MDDEDRTPEAVALDANPSLRSVILGSEEFQAWMYQLPRFEMDGQTFFLPWGDVPLDEDQLIYHWARTTGLLTE